MLDVDHLDRPRERRSRRAIPLPAEPALLVQGLLLEVQEHKVKIHSTNKHPFARLPLALHALRLKSSQARMIAKAAEDAVATDAASRRTSRPRSRNG